MDVKKYLDEQVERINTIDFIKDDPVQFPHRYTRLQDVEIVALLVSHISWGKRKMIISNCERMLDKLKNPYEFILNGDLSTLGTTNIHRTFFENNLAYFIRGLRLIYRKNETLQDYLLKMNVAENPYLAWLIAKLLHDNMRDANNGKIDVRCYSENTDKSALKRLNMALRWLVRDDGIVDLGVWKVLKPSQLFIPLDVHVGDTARRLGLLDRNQNDRKSVEELTNKLRVYCPEDPVRYDFALFGIDV